MVEYRELPAAATVPAGRPDACDFDRMIAALRRFQNGVTGAIPTAELTARITAALDQFSAELEPDVVAEDEQMAGMLRQFPGRAQALVPPLHFQVSPPGELTARVTLGRYYQGRGPAAHGGVIPLLFDEFLGVLVEQDDRPLARTAYLKVDFRAVTPPDVELVMTGRVERTEGRKRFVTASLHAGPTLCARSEALFVELRAGQV